MDNGIVLQRVKDSKLNIRLNPCCSGQWYRTNIIFNTAQIVIIVLILVVVDNGIVQPFDLDKAYALTVLILVVVDNGIVLKVRKLKIVLLRS